MNKKLFLSAVSSEFESYRKLLAQDLKRDTLDVAVQEDFVVTDGTTLEKLDRYIRACDGVVHLIGKATGAVPELVAVQKLLADYPDFPARVPGLAALLAQPDPDISYTQWEAWLAIYHQRPLFVYRPTDFDLAVCECPRELRFSQDAAQEALQQLHYRRICDMGHDRGQFLNQERLSSAVLRDLVEILPRLESRTEVAPTRLTHSASRLIGRDAELTMLDQAWGDPHTNVVVIRGKGGEGKTSLVATWMAELAVKDWRGAERVLDWSFYSQGTKEQSSATAEFFLNRLLTDLGDPDPNLGSAPDRAARLAALLQERRTLLVLDGLEPLQYPPGPMHGALKDSGMAALLRALVAKNSGLVVITTRERVDEIQQHYGRSAIDHDLQFLSPLAGAALLHHAGAQRAGAAAIAPDNAELQKTSREVHGHALTLFLIGNYLRLIDDSGTQRGDILQRDTMKLAEADHEYQTDRTRPYGHAFKAIEAYEKWFAAGDESAHLQLSVLRLLGLFDRPANAESLAALREPSIPGLTDLWTGQPDRQWSITLNRLAEVKLLEVGPNGSIDAHPLVREYFSQQLRTSDVETFKSAHSRLFDHMCQTTPHRPDSLDGLQPLYQAVVHGCLSGRQQEACDKVYFDRIQRGGDAYSTNKLGAIGADLGAVAAFFDEPWIQLVPGFGESDQAWLLNEAAVRLRSLGRLTEALEPMRAATENVARVENWKDAAVGASNLSELEAMLGRLGPAVAEARRAVDFADRSDDWFHRMSKRTTAADALLQSGQPSEQAEARALFAAAESLQREHQPRLALLYSLPGFRYCDLILAPAERAAWHLPPSGIHNRHSDIESALADAERRATQALPIAERNHWLLDTALDLLSLARVALYRAATSPGPPASDDNPNLVVALDGLRKAGTLDYLPKALLTAAHWYALIGDSAAAERHLTEAQHIAERGPMPLFLADVHLHRARLFRDTVALAKAKALIDKHSYGRRYEELADTEVAAVTW